MCKQNPLKEFRTMTGETRRKAIRSYLAAAVALDFAADPHALTHAQRGALHEMAKAVSWRKSISSPLSLGLAFFVYLARDVAKVAIPVTTMRDARRAFIFSQKGRA